MNLDFSLQESMGADTSRGFTLLEVMIAIAILAITLVTVFQSQSQSISMENRSRFLTTAVLLAQAKMSEVEAASTRDIRSGRGDFGDSYPDYKWEMDVKDADVPTLKRIEMVVTNQKLLVNNAFKIVYFKYSSL